MKSLHFQENGKKLESIMVSVKSRLRKTIPLIFNHIQNIYEYTFIYYNYIIFIYNHKML